MPTVEIYGSFHWPLQESDSYSESGSGSDSDSDSDSDSELIIN
jgi:hypothetical protein